MEINPEAHFGLEKYHLALLQYLTRDTRYQSRHVYVDEFTAGFLKTSHAFFRDSESEEAYFKASAQDYTNGIAEAEADFATFLKLAPEESNFSYALGTLAALDMPPAYRSKWNLAQDPKLPEGITYMASLNPREPACFVMLGVVSWKQGDLNLAATMATAAKMNGSCCSLRYF